MLSKLNSSEWWLTFYCLPLWSEKKNNNNNTGGIDEQILRYKIGALIALRFLVSVVVLATPAFVRIDGQAATSILDLAECVRPVGSADAACTFATLFFSHRNLG